MANVTLSSTTSGTVAPPVLVNNSIVDTNISTRLLQPDVELSDLTFNNLSSNETQHLTTYANTSVLETTFAPEYYLNTTQGFTTNNAVNYTNGFTQFDSNTTSLENSSLNQTTWDSLWTSTKSLVTTTATSFYDNQTEFNVFPLNSTWLNESDYSGSGDLDTWINVPQNRSNWLEDENLIPVIVRHVNLTLGRDNDTADYSGDLGVSGSGEVDYINITDLITNGTRIMEDLSNMITSPPPLGALQYSLAEMIIVSILLGVLTLWTVFGNLLVLISLWKFKSLRSMSNLLIGNLAVCDFLLALTVLPMSVVNDVIGHWVFGEILCNLWLITDVLYCTASIWSLCVIAMDRFTATTFPVWYRNKRSLKRAGTYVLIVWVFSIVVSVPPLFGWQDQSKNYHHDNATDRYACILFTNVEYVIYSASGSFIIPLFLQLSLYAKIFSILRRRSKQLSRAYKKSQPKKARVSVERSSVRIPPRDIELSQVTKGEDSTYLFGEESSPDFELKSDADIDDEEVSVAIIDGSTCLYQKNPDTSTALLDGHQITPHRNGLSNTEATDSDTLVIQNPTNRCLVLTETERDSQSDQEKVTLMRKKKTTQHSSTTANSNGNKKAFSSAIKQANPFKRDKMRTSLRRFDKREQRATQRMGIIITCFAVCWLPFMFMYLIRSLCSSCPQLNANAQAFLIWLGYANSGLNPILYTIFNDDFRRAFYKLICCCMEQKKKPQHL